MRRAKGKLVYIEVELRRDEPLTNIVKLWRAIEEKKHSKRVILVHAFSGHFPSKNTHRKNALFIGKHMQRSCNVKYLPLYFGYRPAPMFLRKLFQSKLAVYFQVKLSAASMD